jgi:hypothetical protein
MSLRRTSGSRVLRLAVAVGAACAVGSAGAAPRASTAPAVDPGPVPRAVCGPGSLPEPGAQGRVSAADVASGRAAKGYRCNARLVSHLESSAGYKLQRYVDKAGRQCAYYDSTRAYFPGSGKGTFVVDMTNSAKPVVTAMLTSPAMLSPHESLLVHQGRGLLVAALGYVATAPGIVDVYDVSKDCRKPVLLASSPVGGLGHESAFSPDGKTFWTNSVHLTVAVGLDDPSDPQLLTAYTGASAHGGDVSADGNTFFSADLGLGNQVDQDLAGMTVLDVSEVQSRKPNPQIRLLSALTWPEVSTPQVPTAVTIKGTKYVLETDEFSKLTDGEQVGAARMINVQDPRKPFVVSNIRLEVHQRANRAGDQDNDPDGTSSTGGYSAHYCSVPKRVDPEIAACSMIRSGLRVFDIRNPLKPKEIAYFNQPNADGRSDAVSSIGFAPKSNELWFSDSASGFWAVQLTNGVWGSKTAAPTLPRTTTRSGAAPSAGSGALPATGGRHWLPVTGLLLLAAAAAPLCLRRQEKL